MNAKQHHKKQLLEQNIRKPRTQIKQLTEN